MILIFTALEAFFPLHQIKNPVSQQCVTHCLVREQIPSSLKSIISISCWNVYPLEQKGKSSVLS